MTNRPVAQPINGTLDLHTFDPKDVKDLVPEYLSKCRTHGILQIRIIHGKGIGVLKRLVESIIEKLPYVESFRTAEEEAGGWGATIVLLKK
jgi:DNA-nicking Smr family endonuclease